MHRHLTGGARVSVVALIDSLGISACTLVGHSMGGAIAIHVATMRADAVTSLVMAEGVLDPDPPTDDDLGNRPEADFVADGYDALLAGQAAAALDDPDGIAARHLGITRACDPRALYRERVSMDTWETPTRQKLLGDLAVPCTYLVGELSEPDPEFDELLRTAGISRVVVPGTGHAMGLQNPAGLARAVAEAST